MGTELEIGRRTVAISHPDKVLFPEANVTKLDLARHYEAVAPAMIPYVKERPLALQAFPNGIEHHGFFMKAVEPMVAQAAEADIEASLAHLGEVLA